MTVDVVLDELRELHDVALRAGRLFVGGDLERALVELRDLRFTLDDAIADLGRAVEEEPEP